MSSVNFLAEKPFFLTQALMQYDLQNSDDGMTIYILHKPFKLIRWFMSHFKFYSTPSISV